MVGDDSTTDKEQRYEHDYKEGREIPQQVVRHNYLMMIGHIVRTIQFRTTTSWAKSWT